MKSEIVKVERKAIKVGIAANFIMALSGWGTFCLSGSEALLLDGNMSFILFLTSIVALKIAAIKTKRSETFLFGLFVTEALYSMMKGLLLLGVVISAVTSNSYKIFQFIEGEPIAMIKTGPIVYYAVAMVSICWGLAAFYYFQNHKINSGSSMLKVDQKASMIDGVLSASTGAVLVFIGYVEAGSQWDFLLYIGDALLVVVLALCLLGQPLSIIKQSFVELAGGRLQDAKAHQSITEAVNAELKAIAVEAQEITITKTGSSYLVLLWVLPNVLENGISNSLMESREKLKTKLSEKYTFVDVELLVSQPN